MSSIRNYRLWVGISLMALSIYLVVKLYDTLFLNLRVPVVAVGPDGVLKVIGSIQPFTSPVLAYDIIISIVLTAILSSLASIMIYSAIALRGRNTSSNGVGSLATINDGDANRIINNLVLTNLERKAVSVIRGRGGVITQAELGRELGLSKYQVSRLVKRLEAKGIIERRRAGVTNILILRGNPGSTLGKPGKDKN
ncbi:MAG: helix-turn-helix transcriptional regulator [Vulcanisaeta sp.]